MNEFTYRLFMVYLDLDELETVFKGRLLWSSGAPNVAWLRRADHLRKSKAPWRQAVEELVVAKTGHRPTGRIRLLTHLRYFGFCFNPVSFYYCFNEADTEVETIVAEVNNTPWLEQHCYVLGAESNEARGAGNHRHRFSKDFHVSPFMPMDVDYDWRFNSPGKSLAVHMENYRQGDLFFDATLNMKRYEMTGGNLASALARYPVMTGKVVGLIYWQALRLWLRRTPFFEHPTSEPSATP
jgi:DUF1365 family protein